METPHNFIEWTTEALCNRLGMLAVNLREINYTPQRWQEVSSEQSQVLFEIEQRGQVGVLLEEPPQPAPRQGSFRSLINRYLHY